VTGRLVHSSGALSEKGVKARTVLDSISYEGHRLTTFEVRMHRFVLAEFNTHRVFSRNSASSRAIPLNRQLERVREDLAMPLKFPAEQPGMSGWDEVLDVGLAREEWQMAAFDAANHAEALGALGVHKSVVNRLLEPFMWHIVVVTATSYGNFFGLRVNPGAQPEIHLAAGLMESLFLDSAPTKLNDGEWHLPFIQEDEQDMPNDIAVKVSAARCARVSYLTHNGVRDYEQDVQLYDKLTSARPMHASPLEHVATPYHDNVDEVIVVSRPSGRTKVLKLPRYGNFIGWHSHRMDVEIDADYQAFS
jgi:thymidylate synthase ThyX